MGQCAKRLALMCTIALLVTLCRSEVVIDLKAHEEQLYTETTCTYAVNYEDNYWGYGCPSQVHYYGAESDGEGFWSACKKPSCEMLFYDNMKERPVAVYIEAFVQGSGILEVSGRRTPTFPESYMTITKESASDDVQCSGTLEVNLRNFVDVEAHALNITVTSDRNGYVLIDKVTICFEDDTDCPGPATRATKAFTCADIPTEPPRTEGPGEGTTGGPGGGASRLITSTSVLFAFAAIFSDKLLYFV